jgi:hypothetical protein
MLSVEVDKMVEIYEDSGDKRDHGAAERSEISPD